jgi:hypothetical protein
LFTLANLIYFLFALTFLVVSLFTGNKIRIVIFNIIFLLLTYASISFMLGEAKPVANVPLYFHANWDDEDVYVVGGYWNKENIWLLVKESNNIKTYEWPMSDEFLDALKKAQEKQSANTQGNDRWGFKLKNPKQGQGSNGLDINIPEIELPEPQKDHPIPKEVPQTGVDRNYNVY